MLRSTHGALFERSHHFGSGETRFTQRACVVGIALGSHRGLRDDRRLWGCRRGSARCHGGGHAADRGQADHRLLARDSPVGVVHAAHHRVADLDAVDDRGVHEETPDEGDTLTTVSGDLRALLREASGLAPEVGALQHLSPQRTVLADVDRLDLQAVGLVGDVEDHAGVGGRPETERDNATTGCEALEGVPELAGVAHCAHPDRRLGWADVACRFGSGSFCRLGFRLLALQARGEGVDHVAVHLGRDAVPHQALLLRELTAQARGVVLEKQVLEEDEDLRCAVSPGRQVAHALLQGEGRLAALERELEERAFDLEEVSGSRGAVDELTEGEDLFGLHLGVVRIHGSTGGCAIAPLLLRLATVARDLLLLLALGDGGCLPLAVATLVAGGSRLLRLGHGGPFVAALGRRSVD